MPIIRESFRQGIRSLKTSVLRTTLTMLGMVIGVGSVVIMLTVGSGAQSLILSEIEGLGTNLVFVMAGGDDANLTSSAQLPILKNGDLETLAKPGKVPSAVSASPFTRVGRINMKEGDNLEASVSVWGVSPAYFSMQNVEVEEGRIWTAEEEKSEKKVIVVGGKVDDTIYGEDHGGLVGKRIKIKGQTYNVIGVIKEQKGLLSSFGNENNEYLFVPTPVAQKLIVDTPDYVWGITFKAKGSEYIDQLKEEVTKILRERHKLRTDEKNDFRFMSQDQFVDIFKGVTTVFTLFLSLLASISLFVGGIGIMNIMLVVVTERISEIGVRKALGAKRSQILLQFLIEAMVITSIGGLIGIIFGLIVSFIISLIAGFPFILSLPTILFAFFGSSIFGLVFGIWPAVKASKLDPILAIRHR